MLLSLCGYIFMFATVASDSLTLALSADTVLAVSSALLVTSVPVALSVCGVRCPPFSLLFSVISASCSISLTCSLSLPHWAVLAIRWSVAMVGMGEAFVSSCDFYWGCCVVLSIPLSRCCDMRVVGLRLLLRPSVSEVLGDVR